MRAVTIYPRGEGAIASARGLVKVYGSGETAVRALDGVDVDFGRAELTAIMGPSGSGKSTLMHCMAGLDTLTDGSVVVDGEDVGRMNQRGLTKLRRDRLGFVFQAFNLIPTLTAEENITLPLDIARRPVDREWFDMVVDSIGLRDRLDHRPSELSGGQQQRVALGRALVRRPRLYLLDEPLSNLDALLREGMRAELKALFGRVGATVIYVTHDQTEAMSLSDDLVVMRSGRILQQGAPLDVYRRPADTFVANFVGSPRMTLWQGRREGDALACRGVRVPVPAGLPVADRLCAGMRPEDAEVSARPLAGALEARRVVVEPLGAGALLNLRVGGEDVRVLAEPADWPETLWLRWPPERVHWFDADSGARLAVAGETRE